MAAPRSFWIATNVALRLALIAGATAAAIWIFRHFAGSDTQSDATAAIAIFAGINAAVAGVVFLGPRSTRGPIAWLSAVQVLFFSLLSFFSIGILLLPVALLWFFLAIRLSGKPARGTVMLFSLVVGTLGWSALLFGLLA